jgi:drug/metabolite transporter (DMT)-like permease
MLYLTIFKSVLRKRKALVLGESVDFLQWTGVLIILGGIAYPYFAVRRSDGSHGAA